MDLLKLAALDEEDLKIVSAHVQDAVAKVGDLDYSAATKTFSLVINRFAWELAGTPEGDQRRRSLLAFHRVLSVRSAGIDRDRPDEVLSLLALRFAPTDAPAGTLELLFAGGATIALGVECIEARLADSGGVWAASSRPAHRV